MKKIKLYDITLNESNYWIIVNALESQLCRIDTCRKQDRKKLRQDFYNEQERNINSLLDYLRNCFMNINNLLED